jgi:hypothetical protein
MGTTRMCKFALANDGIADVSRMAARIGATEAIVRETMRWLATQGVIRLGAWDGDRVQVLPGTSAAPASDGGAAAAASGDDLVFDVPPAENGDEREIQEKAQMLIAEMRAWRTFFRRESLDAIGFRKASRA